MQEIMFKKKNIRNISVIAHVDHGKSTLTDALVCRAGLIPEKQSGTKLFTHSRDDEIERGITIKSTAVSMNFEFDNVELLSHIPDGYEGTSFLVNLIDSPGHVDFSSEVTASLRVTDGALLVVDVVSGVSCQTETVLRQALGERIKPVLIINKIDRAILEQKLEPNELYKRLKKIVDDVNNLISIYSTSNEDNGDPKQISRRDLFKCSVLDPSKGNVAFAAGRDGWAFTLTQFANIYNSLKNQKSIGMCNRLWGDNYHDPITNKWTQSSKSEDGQHMLKRGFVQFILDPLYKVLDICAQNKHDELERFCDRFLF